MVDHPSPVGLRRQSVRFIDAGALTLPIEVHWR
jgi:hypothetical protein